SSPILASVPLPVRPAQGNGMPSSTTSAPKARHASHSCRTRVPASPTCCARPRSSSGGTGRPPPDGCADGERPPGDDRPAASSGTAPSADPHVTDDIPVIRLLAEHRPDVLALAEVVSPAVYVEPALLRMARYTLLPQVGSEAEADLWLGP